jgi:protein-tyrosine phosphatase
MAEFVLRGRAEAAGLDHRVEVDSAGTGDWHLGEQADRRTLAALSRRGYDGSSHRARQFNARWFTVRDPVIALDRSRLCWLARPRPG